MIAICMPCGGGMVCMKTAFDLMALYHHTCQRMPRVEIIAAPVGGCYVSLNRQSLADRSLEAGAQAILWIDADQTFPKDGLLRLALHDLPYVGASYRARTPDNGYKVMLPMLGGVAPPGEQILTDDLAYLPGGFCLVRKEVYEAIPRPWYRADFGLDPERPGEFIGEDVYFGLRARQAGFKIWCDLPLTKQVGHILAHEFRVVDHAS